MENGGSAMEKNCSGVELKKDIFIVSLNIEN